MFLDLNKIKQLTIESSSFCNLHCPQCPRFDEHGFLDKNLTPGHLSFDNFSKNFDLKYLPNLKYMKFEGDYGDPVMNPEIGNFVDFFKDINRVDINTNGSIRNKKWFSEIAAYKNVHVVFALDGLEDTNHIYRINANWEKTIENAKSFISAGGNATWKYIVFKHNQHQIEEARQLAKDLGFMDFQVQYSNRNFFGTTIWPVYIDGEFHYDLEMADGIEFVTKSHNVANSIDEFTSPQCSWNQHGDMYINHEGYVLPCCMTSGTTWKNTMSDRLFRKIIGNLNDINLNIHSISDIAQSDFYKFKLKNSFDSIKTCHNICIGNCSKGSVLGAGRIDTIDIDFG